MKKSMIGGKGKSDIHSGKPKEILTHITEKHAKGNIFEGSSEMNPKAKSGCYANAEGKMEK